ncbi:MAG: GGDEF domain-containing protein [Thermoguttaceae bacterium]
MVFLVLMIGVLNICLGYVLAVHVGYGPPGLLEAWDALGGRAEPVSNREVGQFVDEMNALSLDAMLDDEVEDDELFDEIDLEAYEDDDDDVADLLNPNSPENWNLNEKYIETSILKLNLAMIKSGNRATEIDTRLRACQGESDKETIHDCCVKLKEDCESYLTEQSEAAEKFSERVGEMGELAGLGAEIEMGNLEQSAQVETTLSNLQHMDFEADLEAANHRLLAEINMLRVARHRKRDNQEEAFLAMAKYENRMDVIVEQLYNDPLTNLRNRIGLEVTLWQWWKQKRHESRQMNAVLFDIDGFGKINEDYGSLVGDRILYNFADLLREKVSSADLLGRYAGQRFMVIVLDVGPRTATKTAETIRQGLEGITFINAKLEEIQATVSAGLTEVKPEDTVEILFERLEKTLEEAKRDGANRSFFHDGDEMTLVESPNLGAETREIQV